jgi:hypothetical protein
VVVLEYVLPGLMVPGKTLVGQRICSLICEAGTRDGRKEEAQ